MGTRLYPRTKDSAILEQLAGVPTGTYKRLGILNDAEKAYLKARGINPLSDEAQDIGYLFYELKRADGDLDRLDSFIIFGWGKFNYSALNLECYGCMDSGPEAKNLLRKTTGFPFSSISADQIMTMIPGVCWS